MNENDISFIIRGCIFKVYNSLGPGLLESVYEATLVYELQGNGCRVEYQVPIPVIYNEVKLDLGFRADIIVEKKVLVEIKSVENLAEVHHKQILTYLKLTGLRLGILVNFNSENISNSIFRKVNGL